MFLSSSPQFAKNPPSNEPPCSYCLSNYIRGLFYTQTDAFGSNVVGVDKPASSHLLLQHSSLSIRVHFIGFDSSMFM